jgi:hypothetical protein
MEAGSMKPLLVIGLIILMAYSAIADQKPDVPQLHVIKKVTLSPPYSCRPRSEFEKGYQQTALFLTEYSRLRLGPDLLFNGGCDGRDYFESAVGGFDMSLIADLGDGISLEEVAALRAFNPNRLHSFPEYSRFAQIAEVKLNHTYAVVLNRWNMRSLFVFTVTGYIPSNRVDLLYAVKAYQFFPQPQIESPGFDWKRENSLPPAAGSVNR